MKRFKLKTRPIFFILIFIGLSYSCSPNYQENTRDPLSSATEAGLLRDGQAEERGITITSSYVDFPPYNQSALESVYPGNQTAFYDFDANQITNSDEADIYLSVSCGTECSNFLIALGDSMIVDGYANKELDSDECIKRIQSESGTTHTVFGSTSINAHSCIKTSKGNIVQLFIVSNEQRGINVQVVFDYVIWYINN